MEPSRRNPSASSSVVVVAVAVLLVLLAMAADTGHADKPGQCRHLSGKFHAWCLNPNHCADVCRSEGKGYTGGKCHGFPARCYCILPCAAAVAAAAPDAADQSRGGGGAGSLI